MNDKEISTTEDAYIDRERRGTLTSINLNKNLDAKYVKIELAGTSYQILPCTLLTHVPGSPILCRIFPGIS